MRASFYFQSSIWFSKIQKNRFKDEAIILDDLQLFYWKYSLIIQDAVQGFHLENSQATLHPFNVYYRNTNENLESQSLLLFQIIGNIVCQLSIAF